MSHTNSARYFSAFGRQIFQLLEMQSLEPSMVRRLIKLEQKEAWKKTSVIDVSKGLAKLQRYAL